MDQTEPRHDANRAVIGLSGRIASGKTAVAFALANRLNCVRIGLGDYVRAVAQKRGIAASRRSLEDLGQRLVEADVNEFCSNALKFAGWIPFQPAVIDGIRHQVVLHAIRKLVSPLPFLFVYLVLPSECLKERLHAKQISGVDELSAIESHPAEREVISALPKEADMEIRSDQPIERIVAEIIGGIRARSTAEDPSEDGEVYPPTR